MNKVDRYKILVRHLKDLGIVQSQKELGRILGYNNESYFSQIINGQVDEPKDFMEKLKKLVPDLNPDWIQTGDGEMTGVTPPVVQHTENGDNINGHLVEVKTDSGKLLDVILQQSAQLSKSQEQLSKSQEQIDRLISIIERK